MQNNIQVFESHEFGKVRVIHIKGQPWWVLADVCDALGLSNPSKVASRLDEDERSNFKLGRQGLAHIINESGLYAVILRSDKPNAKDFRKWITSKVLLSIRKHGAYITDEILEKMRESEDFAEFLLNRLEQESNLSNALAEFANKAIPKVMYYDIVLQCPEAVQVSIIAKDYGMSAIAFNKLLYKLNVQFRVGKTWLLYAQHQGKGYTVTNTYTRNGMVTLVQTCWTQRGRYWLYSLLKSHGILPEAEKMAAS